MRFPGLALLFLASVTTVFAAPKAAPQAGQQSANANGVDSIIALVQANMSEGLVLKTIQKQNKAYDLTPDDLLKLQKAGVSERIINAMLDPATIPGGSPAPAGVPPPPAAPAPAAAPPAATAAPRAASGPGAANNLVTSGPAGAGTAAKGGPGSANAAAGCSQAAPAAAPAAGQQQQPKGSVFSSFKDRLKGSAQKTVDGFGDTMNCAVDKGVQTSESQVSSVADSAAATPGQAVSNATSTATSTATKPVTTATTNANNAAQTAAKKSAPSATK